MSQPDQRVEVAESARQAMGTARDAGGRGPYGPGRSRRAHGLDAGTDVASTARDAGADVARTARDAGADVGRAVKEEALQVAHTAADQAQQVGVGVRQRMREEVDRQHRQVADRVGTFAEELYTMAGERPGHRPASSSGCWPRGADRSRSTSISMARTGYCTNSRSSPAAGRDLHRRRGRGRVRGRPLGQGFWQNQHESRER